MSDITICDLCKKPLLGEGSEHFKVKKIKASWQEWWWERIDVHEKCLRKLLDAVHDEK